MFWEVWRNVTSATTNWSLGGGSSGGSSSSGGGSSGSGGAKKGLPSSSSSSGHKTRYNRLGSGYPPPKSQSQPANLASLQAYSSSDSLPGCGRGDDNDPDCLTGFPSPLTPLPLLLEENGGGNYHGPGTTRTDLVEIESHFTPNRGTTTTTVRKGSGNSSSSKKNGMKHSFSSFFPFGSCATTTTTSSTSSPPPGTGKNGNLDHQQQKKQGQALAMGNGNGDAMSWDQGRREMGTGISSSSSNMENDEEEISDLDDEVEHLTCDVCERAFPTLKLLASHQRKKRHYGCLQCDSIFPSREVLECHREQMCHYDYAIDVYDEDEENFFESDDDEHGLRVGDEDCDDEERERLL